MAINGLIRQSTIAKLLLSFSWMLLSAGCLPKDVPLTETPADSSIRYAGFNGITSAETTGATRVLLKWEPSTDPSVVAYNIYDTSFKFSPKLIRTVSAPASQVTLNSLNNQTLYGFRVRATNVNNVEDTNTKDLPAIPYGGIVSAQVLSSTSARLTYNSATNADQVNLFCKKGSDAYTQVATVRNPNLTSYDISDLESGAEYTCRAALEIEGYVDNNPFTAVFTPMGQAATLVFSTQPSNSGAGVVLPNQPVITIKDANGNVVSGGPDSTADITLNVATSSPSGGTINGTTTVAAVNGVATFTGLSLNQVGTKILTATKEDTSAVTFGTGPLTANSNSFVISAGPVSPQTSTIEILPAVPPAEPLTANGTDAYTVTITLKDEFGNPVTGLRPNFASNIQGDTLIQSSQATNGSGQATGYISTTIADYAPVLRQLNLSAPGGLSSVITYAPFKPGAANKLAFLVQPVNSPAGLLGMAQVQVVVQDAQGNRITSGTGADSEIALSINNNLGGAVLSGTTPRTAVNGVAIFNDLGIDKTATGYKLIASSGNLVPAYSSTFNITAGVPNKVSITGPPNVLSGKCSEAITVRLLDVGNNPAGAIGSTTVTLSGLGGAKLYSAGCNGSALSNSITFTSSVHTRTVYLKDNKAEALTIVGTDSSSVLAAGTLNLTVSPSKVGFLAQAAAPAPASTPLSVIAGQCSTEMRITPMGEDNNPGPTFLATPLALTGILNSQAKVFSDPSCSAGSEINPSAFNLPVNTGPDFAYKIYLKDPKAETLNLSVQDPDGLIVTTTSPQTVTILPSNIYFTGPNSVVAGDCSTAFTIQLRDGQGNTSIAADDVPLTINGIPESSSGRFYTSANCSQGAGSRTALTFPQGQSSLSVYFKSVASDSLSISISDSANLMATSQTVNLKVSPSAFKIVTPLSGSEKTNICAGPFKLQTLDAVGTPTNAVSPITANLSGQGDTGAFYSDSSCTNGISTLSFIEGQKEKNFYFMGYFPEASLTLTATDPASVLDTGTATWAITGAKAWLGTASQMTDASGNLLWFRPDVKPVAARYDGLYSPTRLTFNPGKTHLYVSDIDQHRVLKYDYANQSYVGWIGGFNSVGGIGIKGSTLPSPYPQLCVATGNNTPTPGWCLGGQSLASGNTATGFLYSPVGLAEDGSYLYVVNNSSHSVSRFDASTGAFQGFIGQISNTSGLQPAPNGGPASCNPTSTPVGSLTPGWCRGGSTGNPNGDFWNYHSGNMLRHPSAISFDEDYIYVLEAMSVARFEKATGAPAGWIGIIHTAPTGGAGCTDVGVDVLTPGWCYGGMVKKASSVFNHGNNNPARPGGISDPTGMFISGNDLYVYHGSGIFMRYDKTTGALMTGGQPSSPNNWIGVRQIAVDSTNGIWYFADRQRLLKTDTSALVLGWMGKVANNNNMSGNAGCSSLNVNDNTPGWCLGGSSRPGMDSTSFRETEAIALDGQGKLIVGVREASGELRKFDAATGVYEGTFSLESLGPTRWSNNTELPTEYHSYDDYGMYSPTGVHVSGDNLFVAEFKSSRIKKILRKTGEFLGSIGAITTKPSGGGALCLSANPFAASPGWCLGANFLPDFFFNNTAMINNQSNGILLNPQSMTSDGTYLYVVDRSLHRISRYQISTGAAKGWIGRIGSAKPTGPDTNCQNAAVDSFTPGWCNGGISREGTGDGHLYFPTGITYAGGNLYVIDSVNRRISSYDAGTGAFNGWIGRIGTNPQPGTCTYGNPPGSTTINVSLSGWCKGGTSFQGETYEPGGFTRWANTWRDGGITSATTADGTHLYVTNFYASRIDKIDLNGVFVGAAGTKENNYTGTWKSTWAEINALRVSCSYPLDIWTDGTHLYGTNHSPCDRVGSAFGVWKMNLSTGQMQGWQGGIDPSNLPNDGEQGCSGATESTPGWCRNGRSMLGLYLGQFSGSIGFVSGDSHFIYVSDETGNRVTRIPK